MAEKAGGNNMANVVGVRFRRNGKIYYFDSSDIELKAGDLVVVETTRGLEMGEVVIAGSAELAGKINKTLKSVVRKASIEDIERYDKLRQKEGEALAECAKMVGRLELPMKLISAEYNIDGSRLTVFFSAEGRVDFRELVRDLSRHLKARVEMRQVGPRDEARILGGFGRCGRPLCCASFLHELNPVSIKMAKEQGLPLNPMKISGLCGRLLCCLGYEFEQYRAMREKMPPEGKQISTAMGEATVVGGNPIEGTVLVELESGARVELPLDEIADTGKDKGSQNDAVKKK